MYTISFTTNDGQVVTRMRQNSSPERLTQWVYDPNGLRQRGRPTISRAEPSASSADVECTQPCSRMTRN